MHTECLMALKLWKVLKAIGKRISAILSCLGEVTLFTHTLKKPQWPDGRLTDQDAASSQLFEGQMETTLNSKLIARWIILWTAGGFLSPP